MTGREGIWINHNRLYQSLRQRRKSTNSSPRAKDIFDEMRVDFGATQQRKITSRNIQVSKQGVESLLADLDTFSNHLQAQKKKLLHSSSKSSNPRIHSVNSPTSSTQRCHLTVQKSKSFALRGTNDTKPYVYKLCNETSNETSVKRSKNAESQQKKLLNCLVWVRKNSKKAAKKYNSLMKKKSSVPTSGNLNNNIFQCNEAIDDRKCCCQSLQDVLNSKECTKEFRAFLTTELSVENLDFFLAVESFKIRAKESHPRLAKEIFDSYLAPNSPHEVNIDFATRKQTKENLQQPSTTAFDIAQQEIYRLMESDSFQRFFENSE